MAILPHFAFQAVIIPLCFVGGQDCSPAAGFYICFYFRPTITENALLVNVSAEPGNGFLVRENVWYNKKHQTDKERSIDMKEYQLVYLNKGFSTSREKDLQKADEKINEMTEQGWELQQVVSPSDGVGALIGVFYKERKL